MPRTRHQCSVPGCDETYEPYPTRKTTRCMKHIGERKIAWPAQSRAVEAPLTRPWQRPRTMPPSQGGLRIAVIPDTQVAPGVPTEHMDWIGAYLADKKPDVIVHIGDHWTMDSLSTHEQKGSLAFEGRRYSDDVLSGVEAMRRMMRFIPRHDYVEGWKPRLVFTMGNHEQRIERAIDAHPTLYGTIGYRDLMLEEMGWEVFPFLQPVEIAGIEFAHYFVSGVMGRPVTSAAALIRGKYARRGSAVMGHVQNFDYAVSSVTGRFAIFAGCAYLHDEAYLGPQVNPTAKRQIVMLHEARDGNADPMFVSLSHLEKRFKTKS